MTDAIIIYKTNSVGVITHVMATPYKNIKRFEIDDAVFDKNFEHLIAEWRSVDDDDEDDDDNNFLYYEIPLDGKFHKFGPYCADVNARDFCFNYVKDYDITRGRFLLDRLTDPDLK